MRHFVLLPAIILFTALLNTGAAHVDREDFPEVQKETIRKTLDFSNPSARGEVNVDNVDGAIHVTGYGGQSVILQAVKTVRGPSKDDIERAGKEVELRISEKNNRVEFYVDGPFRCENGSIRSRRLGYRVSFDFEIQVPHQCAVSLQTVNNGEIRLENVTGRFDLENVNGGILLNEIAGEGSAHTINGAVKATFSRNPMGDCSFKSLNGDVDVAFQADLSADVWFKTFNGSAYTDFNLMPLPQRAAEPERRNGKLIYRSNDFYGARIGKGGPQLKFDTFNGSIHVTVR